MELQNLEWTNTEKSKIRVYLAGLQLQKPAKWPKNTAKKESPRRAIFWIPSAPPSAACSLVHEDEEVTDA